mmetsp:Transcript_43678/g.132211  ORF Transcript_43678/g.132211 Transcript_43678/m.132211 type:complete len:230 (-) Transcript_43678:565-1254(-)
MCRDPAGPRPPEDGGRAGRGHGGARGARPHVEAPGVVDEARGGPDAVGPAAGPLGHRPRAEGRGAADRTVELPGELVAHGRRRRCWCGQLLRVETLGGVASHGASPCGHDAEVPRCLGDRRDPGRRPRVHGAAQAPVGPHSVHRQRDGGARGRQGRRRAPDAVHPRAGRQVAHAGPARGEPRRGGEAHLVWQDVQLRPDLHRAGLRACPQGRGEAVGEGVAADAPVLLR